MLINYSLFPSEPYGEESSFFLSAELQEELPDFCPGGGVSGIVDPREEPALRSGESWAVGGQE